MKVIYNNGEVGKCSAEDELHIIRHTAAHILAQAVKRLYPDAMFGYGPATDNGFYYDIDLGNVKISEDDLPAIENEMNKIVDENLPLIPFSLDHDKAVELMNQRNERYKVEHIADLTQFDKISFFKQGEYIDMCVGPHLCYTKSLKAFKLVGISGAYWKNDKDNTMLTRIYGIAFNSKSELENYLVMIQEAEKRDHRKIGKEMQLFMFNEEAPGFPFFLPNGIAVKNALIEYWRTIHLHEEYVEVSTPMIMNRHLWETSGHWDHYKNNMYPTQIDDEDYCIKPMNCPGGVIIYQNRPHSYKELPIRVAELGVVHRHELKGALHGLFRVRAFTQDDAHIFMRRDQITQEIVNVVHLINKVYEKFEFKYSVELSTRPQDSMGSDEDWENAENGLIGALDALNMPYTINEGDGAFYGPKIDFHLEDSLGRTWQCGTIQLDFQMPINFNLEYIDENGTKQRPIMIHRVCFGSIERFIAILTEHYAGKYPIWLAPIQVKVLPVSEKSNAYAEDLYARLKNSNIRCELDDRDEKIGYKIRQAQMVDRVPYMIIVGQKEVETNTVSVRLRESGDTVNMTFDEFEKRLLKEIKERS